MSYTYKPYRKKNIEIYMGKEDNELINIETWN